MCKNYGTSHFFYEVYHHVYQLWAMVSNYLCEKQKLDRDHHMYIYMSYIYMYINNNNNAQYIYIYIHTINEIYVRPKK